MTTASPSPGATLAVTGEGDRLAFEGALDIRTLATARRALSSWLGEGKARILDLARLEALDTPGALFLCDLRGREVELAGVRAEHQALLDLICGLAAKPLPAPRRASRGRALLVQLGRGVEDIGRDAFAVVSFLGWSAAATLRALVRPRYLSLASVTRQVSETGIDALPIIGLMAVMISVVIGYQGVAQLRPYGGEEFTINLVAVSVLREMGVLITAIMVAGRSGSAFTAEIGVMRAREEVDALRVMGLDPMEMLVVPRVIGLAVTLPLLTFFADAMGLLGGAGIAEFLLHVPPAQYLERVHLAADVHDLTVGLVKAPIFALIIAVVGCMHGMRVAGSAESVGRETTRAVVKSIFLVIVLDALFSIFFEKVGL